MEKLHEVLIELSTGSYHMPSLACPKNPQRIRHVKKNLDIFFVYSFIFTFISKLLFFVVLKNVSG